MGRSMGRVALNRMHLRVGPYGMGLQLFPAGPSNVGIGEFGTWECVHCNELQL